jgi:hypothetical protein
VRATNELLLLLLLLASFYFALQFFWARSSFVVANNNKNNNIQVASETRSPSSWHPWWRAHRRWHCSPPSKHEAMEVAILWRSAFP